MTGFTSEDLGHAQWLKSFEDAQALIESGAAEVGPHLIAVAELVPGGKGGSAYAKAAGVSASHITRYAAAGTLLASFGTLPGATPKGVTGVWALGQARTDKGGAGAKAIYRAIRESDTCQTLWSAIGGAAAETKQANAKREEDKRAARPNDGTSAEPSEPSEPVGTPAEECLRVARDLAKRLGALQKIGTEQGDVLAKIATALDASARRVAAMRETLDATRAEVPAKGEPAAV